MKRVRLKSLSVTGLIMLAMIHGVAAAPIPEDEETWIVGEVVQQLVRITSLSGAKKGDAPIVLTKRSGKSAFDVTVGKASSRITLTKHIWDPAGYEPLAKILLAESGDPKPDLRPLKVTDKDPAAVLVTLTAENLEQLNQTVSGQLRKAPNSPGLHNRAAFLLGAFALRENNGNFYDTRLALSKMTAHMAFAHVLEGKGRVGARCHCRRTPVTDFA
jgi:hypothetical protein